MAQSLLTSGDGGLCERDSVKRTQAILGQLSQEICHSHFLLLRECESMPPSIALEPGR